MSIFNLEWLGHTTLRFETEKSQFVLKPFFKAKIGFHKRQKLFAFNFDSLKKADAILFSNAKSDRFDADALRFFKQKQSQIHLPKSLQSYVERFFHFETKALKDAQTIELGDISITPLASDFKHLRFFNLHPKSFHFLIEAHGKTILILSEAKLTPKHIEHLKTKSIDFLVLPFSSFRLRWLKPKQTYSFDELENLINTLNIQKFAYFSYGFYGDNFETVQKTLREAFQNKELENRFLNLKPFAKTSLLFDEANTQGPAKAEATVLSLASKVGSSSQ